MVVCLGYIANTTQAGSNTTTTHTTPHREMSLVAWTTTEEFDAVIGGVPCRIHVGVGRSFEAAIDFMLCGKTYTFMPTKWRSGSGCGGLSRFLELLEPSRVWDAE